jgi:hypothetical protein
LRKAYGFDVTAVDPRGVAQAEQAVQSGQDQMVLTTTTDATLDDFGLVLLADDRHLQNARYIVPVVNRARVGGAGVRRAGPARHRTDDRRSGIPERAGGQLAAAARGRRQELSRVQELLGMPGGRRVSG